MYEVLNLLEKIIVIGYIDILNFEKRKKTTKKEYIIKKTMFRRHLYPELLTLIVKPSSIEVPGSNLINVVERKLNNWFLFLAQKDYCVRPRTS